MDEKSNFPADLRVDMVNPCDSRWLYCPEYQDLHLFCFTEVTNSEWRDQHLNRKPSASKGQARDRPDGASMKQTHAVPYGTGGTVLYVPGGTPTSDARKRVKANNPTQHRHTPPACCRIASSQKIVSGSARRK